MKWDELIGLRIAELIVKQLASDERVTLSQGEDSLRKIIEQKIQENFKQEKQLVEAVYEMMENLENQGHKFERQKMFPLLKTKLAKKKGIIL